MAKSYSYCELSPSAKKTALKTFMEDSRFYDRVGDDHYYIYGLDYAQDYLSEHLKLDITSAYSKGDIQFNCDYNELKMKLSIKDKKEFLFTHKNRLDRECYVYLNENHNWNNEYECYFRNSLKEMVFGYNREDLLDEDYDHVECIGCGYKRAECECECSECEERIEDCECELDDAEKQKRIDREEEYQKHRELSQKSIAVLESIFNEAMDFSITSIKNELESQYEEDTIDLLLEGNDNYQFTEEGFFYNEDDVDDDDDFEDDDDDDDDNNK